MDEQLTIAGQGVAKLSRARPTQWTAARRLVFLNHLSSTCSVKKSAEAADVTSDAAYWLRRREPAFAEAWAEALAQGYQQIEMQLLERALGHAAEHSGENARPFDPELGLRILQMRHAGTKPSRAAAQTRVTRAPIEQVEASLRKKLDALAKRLKEDL